MVISKYRARVAALEEELHRLEALCPPSTCSGAASASEALVLPHSGKHTLALSQQPCGQASEPGALPCMQGASPH